MSYDFSVNVPGSALAALQELIGSTAWVDLKEVEKVKVLIDVMLQHGFPEDRVCGAAAMLLGLDSPEFTTEHGDIKYTYNVGGMYREAFKPQEGGVDQLHEMDCNEASKHLQRAIDAMKADPDKYKVMNPANGWGDYEGAMRTLNDLLVLCQEHPEGTVVIS